MLESKKKKKLPETYHELILLGPVPEKPISANPELKFSSTFRILPPYALLKVTICVIIPIFRSKDSTVRCKLE